VKTKSRVISHAWQEVGKPGELAGWLAVGQSRRAAWGPNANEKEQSQDRGGSECDWLQKAEEKLTDGHCKSMGARGSVGHITTRVDLTCAQDGGHERRKMECYGGDWPIWAVIRGQSLDGVLNSSSNSHSPESRINWFPRVGFRRPLLN
jgi:hypothetical protein